MCTYTTLQHNQHGYVALCRSCAQVKVAFANTILCFSKSKFNGFVRQIDELRARHSNDAFMDRKSVLIPTAAKGVTMVFTPHEIQALHKLLTGACGRLKYEELLIINKN